jgi:hypothetical protein
MGRMIDPNQHDRFVLRQRIKLVINQYAFSVPDASGDGAEFCFVEQKRFKFKEDIRFSPTRRRPRRRCGSWPASGSTHAPSTTSLLPPARRSA